MQWRHEVISFRFIRITLIWIFCLLGLHACGGGGATQATVPPTIVTAPISQTVSAGQTGTFSTYVSGDTPLNYQWQRNGVDIVDVTTASYSQKVQLADSGSIWTVRVSNTAGTVTSTAATLTVLAVPTGSISLMAGSTGGPGNRNGVGPAARFNFPSGLATDAAGNIYVADSGNNRIQKVTPAGLVTTLAGSRQSAYMDGQGSAAAFYSPSGVAVDAAGNVYVVDTFYNVIRKITPAGLVTTLAGTPKNGATTFGSGAADNFNAPTGLAIDTAGNLYVADTNNFSIKKITPSGMVTTLAGGTSGKVDGVGVAAIFSYPEALAVDPAGNVYVIDADSIRKISPDGLVTTLVSASAGLKYPTGIAVNSAGSVLVADAGNNVIWKVTASGAMSVVAGTVGVAGAVDGPVATASFSASRALAMDSSDNLYIADAGNSTIRRVSPAGTVTTLAGAAPAGVTYGAYQTTDVAGNVYVSVSTGNNASTYGIQRIAPAGVATTIAIGLTGPQGIAVDAGGNVYVADNANTATSCFFSSSNCGTPAVVRKISPQGDMTTLAGSFNQIPHADGVGASASLISPRGLTIDAGGNLYLVEDLFDGSIRKITPAGVVTTLSTISQAKGLAIDQAGNVYAAVCWYPLVPNNSPPGGAIYKVSPTGVSTLLAGALSRSGSADGAASTASFSCPTGVAQDGSGNLYIADTGNNTIRMISTAGSVSTVAGQTGVKGITLGALPASLGAPTGVSVDAMGILYVGSSGAILKIQFSH